MIDAIRTDREKRHDLRRAWGSFLATFTWSFWITLTFQHATGKRAAEQAFERWFRRLIQSARRKLGAFRVVESGRLGRVHIHVLLDDCEQLSEGRVIQAWDHGKAQVDPYDREQGATFYIAKFVLDEAADYDVVGQTRRWNGSVSEGHDGLPSVGDADGGDVTTDHSSRN